MQRKLYILFLCLLSLLTSAFLCVYVYWQQLLPWAAGHWLERYQWQISEISSTAPTSDGWHIDYLELQKLTTGAARPEQTDTLRFNQLQLKWNLTELFQQQRLQRVKLKSADISIFQQASAGQPSQPLDLQSWFATAYIRQIPAGEIQLEQLNLKLTTGQNSIGLRSNISLTNPSPDMPGQLNWQTELTEYSSRPELVSLQLVVSTQIHAAAIHTELQGLQLKLQYQQHPLLSSQGSLIPTASAAANDTQPQPAFQLTAAHQLELATLQQLLQQLQPERPLPELTGQLSLSGTTHLQGKVDPENIWQSLQPVTEQNFQLSITPLSLTELTASAPEGKVQLQLNGQLSSNSEHLNIRLLPDSQLEIHDLKHPGFSAGSLNITPANKLDLSLPATLFTANSHTTPINLEVPSVSLDIYTASLQLPVRHGDNTEYWQLKHTPLRLTTAPARLCISACAGQPLPDQLDGTIKLEQLTVSAAAFPLPELNWQSSFSYQMAKPAEQQQSLKQTFTAAVSDPLLASGQLRLKGKSETLIAEDSATVTSAHWRFAIDNLQGIEALIRRYSPDVPTELTISAGKLFHRGALHATQGQIALRLQQDISNLDGQYQQSRWLGASLTSDLRRSHQGRIHDTGKLTVNFIAAGIPVEQFSSLYSLSSTNSGYEIHLDELQASILGGQLSTSPVTLSDSLQTSAIISLEQIQLGEVLALEQQEGLNGEGLLSGTIPLAITADGLRVTDGSFTNLNSGRIRYQPTEALRAVAQGNSGLRTALKALENLHYQQLDIGLNYEPDGSTRLNTRLQGHNPDWNNAQPIDFTINIEENLLQLIKALQYTNKLTRSLEKRYR